MRSLKNIKRQILLIVCILFVNGFIQAENSQVVVHVSKDVRLAEAMTAAELIPSEITNIKIVGDFNSADVRTLKAMATEKLSDIDLFDANYIDSIGFNFRNCGALKKIRLMQGIEEIEDSAFFSSGLLEIKIPKTILKIGFDAFYGSNLSRIEIEDLKAWCSIDFKNFRVGYDGLSLLLNGEELKEITIPKDFISIKNYVFNGFNNITSVKIPDNVEKIGIRSFGDCWNLKNVKLPNAIEKIDSMAFIGCESLVSMEIPQKVTRIEYATFCSCSKLSSITIPNNLTYIGNCAFEYCKALETISLPKKLSVIGDNCFKYCVALNSLTIPDNVASIGSGAFGGCKKLSSLSIPASVTHIGENVFCDCDNLVSIYVYREQPAEIEGFRLHTDCNLSEHCTLYVPKGCVEAYRSSNWNTYFNNIKEFDAETGVHATVASSQPTETSRYDINGRKIEKLAKGINIIKYSDGSVRKEFAK